MLAAPMLEKPAYGVVARANPHEATGRSLPVVAWLFILIKLAVSSFPAELVRARLWLCGVLLRLVGPRPRRSYHSYTGVILDLLRLV